MPNRERVLLLVNRDDSAVKVVNTEMAIKKLGLDERNQEAQ
jgi:hypothetical protein